MMVLTRPQREALKQVYDRPIVNRPAETYRQFRRKVRQASYDTNIMVPWCNMWLGIEPDGYTHS